jgi:transposase
MRPLFARILSESVHEFGSSPERLTSVRIVTGDIPRIHQLEQVTPSVPANVIYHIPFGGIMERIVGIDASKDSLDGTALPSGEKRYFTNDSAGIVELVAWSRQLAPERIIFESTGHYQKAAVGALLAASLPAVVVNARQTRDFAKGLGILAKTDPIDSGVLARFGQVVATTVRPLPLPEIQEFQDLCDRRGQLVRMVAIEKNHRHASTSTRVLKNIDTHIAFLKKQIEALEDRMDRFVENCDAFRAKDEVLQSVPGFGPQVSRTLLAHLPELGQRSRQRISALVGLAPYNDDSGMKGRARHIRGGRGKVRIALYQAAVVAIRHCAEMKEFYIRLKARGKVTKVALVAVARKLLVLANALVRSMTPYEERANSVCPKNA